MAVPLTEFAVCAGNTLVSDHSDLFQYGIERDRFPSFISVQNDRSGNTVHFEKTEQLMKDGEVAAFDYYPSPQSQRAHPKVKGWKLRIFND
jgi:hypothetical protein